MTAENSIIGDFKEGGRKWLVGTFYALLTGTLMTLSGLSVATYQIIHENRDTARDVLAEQKRRGPRLDAVEAQYEVLERNQFYLFCDVRTRHGETCELEFMRPEN